MRIIKVALALLACVGALFSQGLPPPPPDGTHTDQVKAYLTLSDQQLQDLAAIQSSLREASDPLMQQVGEKMRALREALQQDTVDSALVTQLKADIAGLQSQLQSLRATFRPKALAILSYQQKAVLANLQQALDLMPSAFQAASLNLLDAPLGFPGGRGVPH
ncbi:MAG TPA: periplasmic heavy metal sensor [Acidobacteriota bacterium]|nr:periplasmic heavy metal sensor [Acidobacteriota bacterium]